MDDVAVSPKEPGPAVSAPNQMYHVASIVIPELPRACETIHTPYSLCYSHINS